MAGIQQTRPDCSIFCGSKKTLASGVPMAQILFAGQPLGMIVLPIMIFHQIQLMVCGVIANYWSKQDTEEYMGEEAAE